jgi:2-polyprenyl-3-methyl-5-hydroxy-6-metoxy-1,4-benzoquinol methylase
MDILEEGNLSTEDALGHWYYRAKFGLLSRHLKAAKVSTDGEIADVGCGLGLFLRMLRRSGRPAQTLTGVDIGFSEVRTDAVDGFTIYPTWPQGANYDAILMMDVLEHCPDDTAVLRDATNHLKPGGTMFVTVPAFRSLWSAHDVFLKHCRRYNARELGELIAREPRLKIESLHYFYGLLFPAAALQRWLHRNNKNPKSSEMKTLPAPLNALLLFVCRLESVLMRCNRIAGLTVVARCRRV